MFTRKSLSSAIAAEAQRGADNARKFLAGGPSDAEIMGAWDAASAYEEFDDAVSRAYDRAYKDVIRPTWVAGMRRRRGAASATFHRPESVEAAG